MLHTFLEVSLSLQLFKHWANFISPQGTVLRGKYEAFKQLLESDKRSYELVAELEDIYYQQKKSISKPLKKNMKNFQELYSRWLTVLRGWHQPRMAIFVSILKK